MFCFYTIVIYFYICFGPFLIQSFVGLLLCLGKNVRKYHFNAYKTLVVTVSMRYIVYYGVKFVNFIIIIGLKRLRITAKKLSLKEYEI